MISGREEDGIEVCLQAFKLKKKSSVGQEKNWNLEKYCKASAIFDALNEYCGRHDFDRLAVITSVSERRIIKVWLRMGPSLPLSFSQRVCGCVSVALRVCQSNNFPTSVR